MAAARTHPSKSFVEHAEHYRLVPLKNSVVLQQTYSVLVKSSKAFIQQCRDGNLRCLERQTEDAVEEFLEEIIEPEEKFSR